MKKQRHEEERRRRILYNPELINRPNFLHKARLEDELFEKNKKVYLNTDKAIDHHKQIRMLVLERSKPCNKDNKSKSFSFFRRFAF